MDTNDAPLSEFDSEHEHEEDQVIDLGEVSRKTKGGWTGVQHEPGYTWFFM